MTARVLVVDGVDANVNLLEARLTVGRLDVTASLGVAALEFDHDAPELMLKLADQALYCVKRDGRNRVVADAA